MAEVYSRSGNISSGFGEREAKAAEYQPPNRRDTRRSDGNFNRMIFSCAELLEASGMSGRCSPGTPDGANFDNLQTARKSNIGDRIARLTAQKMQATGAAVIGPRLRN